METLENSSMCRLCGKTSGISINIFDSKEAHVRKINSILPISVHEMDMLPKHMCHRCSYRLEEFYSFYVQCAKTDKELKNQLSWMSKETTQNEISTPMVKLKKFKIKSEQFEDLDNYCMRTDVKVPDLIDKNCLNFLSNEKNHLVGNQESVLCCLNCQCNCNKDFTLDQSLPESYKSIDKSAASSNLKLNNSKKVIQIQNSNLKSDDLKTARVLLNADTVDTCLFNNSLNKEKCSMDSKDKQNLSFPVFKNDLPTRNRASVDFDAFNKMNRSLRPRRSSIDYVGPKKKTASNNTDLKTKSDKKDDVDSQTNVTLINSNTSAPVIKLEKVDDVPVRDLRKRRCSISENIKTKKIKLQSKKGLTNGEISLLVNSEIETSTSSTDPAIIKPLELKIKKEKVDANLANSCNHSKPIQDTVVSEENLQKESELPDLQPVVKLEKDCKSKSDCSKPKIKKQMKISPNSVRKNINKNILQVSLTKVATTKDDKVTEIIRTEVPAVMKTIETKKPEELAVKKKEKKDKIKKKKNSKKRNKHSRKHSNKSFVNKMSSTLNSLAEIKKFCEKCDTCFKNNELYRLHPCYQK